VATAFTPPPQPGDPTHDTLYTRVISSMNGMNGLVSVDSSIASTNNISAAGVNSVYGIEGRHSSGYYGRLGTSTHGVYAYGPTGLEARNPNGVYAMLADPLGFGLYTPNGVSAGYYSGGPFSGSSVSTGPIAASSLNTAGACSCGAVSASDTVDANKGFSKSGLAGTSGSYVFTDTSGAKITITVTGGIVTSFG